MSDKLYRIKSLEWRNMGDGRHIAHSPFGTYIILSDGEWEFISDDDCEIPVGDYFTSVQEASQKSQSHFEAAMSAGLVEAVCEWTPDVDGLWKTGCGADEQNRADLSLWSHCNFCGGKITEADHAR